jgi:hypothetical protein
VYPQSLTFIQAAFDVPAGSRGTWNLVLTNPEDGTTGTYLNALTIN